MKFVTLCACFLFCVPSINTELNLKDINKLFGNEECIEGDIKSYNGKIINFINGQSAQRVKETVKHKENQMIGGFFPDAPLNKSPISILTELAKVNKLAEPYYHLENKKGPDHQPVFTVLLLFAGREFRSQANSIKKAKNGAAQAALDSGTIPANTLKSETKSPGEKQEEQTPMTQLNNIALKLKMKVEYIREKYQRDVEIYGGSHTGFINLGKKKSYEERLNASIYKTIKKGPDPDGEDTKGPFTYLVKVGDKLEYRANGRTKQGAKQNAAEQALNAFKEMNLQDAIDCLRDGNECNAANVKSPISILQELAQHYQFPITYTLISETGLSHKKTFQIRCEILDGVEKLFTDGEASSKKDAKRLAAMKMVDKLSSTAIAQGRIKIGGYKKKSKKKKSKINRSDLLLLKEAATNKVMSVYEYFTTEEDKKNENNEEDSSKQRGNSKDKIITDEDFASFDDSVDYKRRLRSILDDYNLQEEYIELEEGHRRVALLVVPANPKLICIAEAVDVPSAKEMVSYHALKWILSNSDFQFKNMYQENNMPSIKESGGGFIYSDVKDETD